MKIKLFFIALAFSLGLNAQTKSDSLSNLINTNSNWDEKARLTYEFAKLNIGSNPAECLAKYNLIEKNEDQLTDSAQLFNAYNIKGVIYQFRHEIDSSNLYLEKAKEISLLIKDSVLLIKSIGNLGINYRNIGEYKKAIECALISLDYYKNNNDTSGIAKSYAQLANSYIHLNNYVEAMTNVRKANFFFKARNDLTGIANTYGSIGYIFTELNELDSSLFYHEIGYKTQIKANDVYGIANAKRSLCSIYKKINKSNEECLKCNRELLEIDLRLKDKRGIMLDYLNMGTNLYNLNRYSESLPNTLKALELSKKLDDKRVKLECFEIIALTYYWTKKYQKAYRYLDSTRKIEQKILDIDIQQSVLDADKKYQLADKERELLKIENEKAQAELKVSEKSKQVGFLISGILILMVLSGAMFYRIKQKQLRKLDKIRIEEQQKGLAAVIEGQEQERQRIAKDLHDGIVQQLVGLKLGMQNLFQNNESEASNKIIEILDNSSEELRELSHKMMPRSLAGAGLIPAIQDMLTNSLGNTSMKFTFENFGLTKRFSENIEIAVFRISQELINNVIKHSNAQNVFVQLFKTGGHLVLIVEDDGSGLTASQPKKGIGLMNITSRLDTINGNVDFKPSGKSGTLATVRIPVRPETA